MPWQKGETGNPHGRPKRAISQGIRRAEFRRSFLQLMRIRDGRIRELDYEEDGKRIWVYPSISNLIAACVKIMEYTAGKPEQKISLDVVGEAEKPNALQIVLNLKAEEETELSAGILLERPQNITSKQSSIPTESDGIARNTDLRNESNDE